MSSCSVTFCNNYNQKTKDSAIKYFQFPKDSSLQKVWIVKCKRVDKINTEHARVCSIHFREDDFERDLKNDLLGLPLRRILRKDAIPSINLPNQIRSENFNFDDENQPELFESARLLPSNIRTLRSKNREIRKRAVEIVSTLSPKKKKIEKIDFQTRKDMTSIKHKK